MPSGGLDAMPRAQKTQIAKVKRHLNRPLAGSLRCGKLAACGAPASSCLSLLACRRWRRRGLSQPGTTLLRLPPRLATSMLKTLLCLERKPRLQERAVGCPRRHCPRPAGFAAASDLRSLYVVGGRGSAPVADVCRGTLAPGGGVTTRGALSRTYRIHWSRLRRSLIWAGCSVIGGSDGGVPVVDVLFSTIQQDGSLSSWRATTPLPAPRLALAATVARADTLRHGWLRSGSLE